MKPLILRYLNYYVRCAIVLVILERMGWFPK